MKPLWMALVEERNRKIRGLRQEGRSIGQIADEMAVSEEIVRNVVAGQEQQSASDRS